MQNDFKVNKSKLAFKAIIFCMLSITAQASDNKFMEGVIGKSTIYETYSSSHEARQMALVGQQDQVDMHLLSLVPNADKTAEDYFLIANMLYENNHALSFELMKKAHNLNPDEIAIVFEMAMHYHRAGEYAQAINYYQQAMRSEFISEGHMGYALLADCYLRVGIYEKAIDAWLVADPYNNRLKIDKAIFSIYGGERPNSRRSALIKKIKAGDVHKLGDLVVLDHHWDFDWWNQSVKEEYLEHDLKLASEILINNKGLHEELILLNDLLAHQVNTQQFMERLEILNIWGSDSKLPAIPALTYYMVKKMTDLELVEADAILSAYEIELLKKKKNKTIDDYEFKILSFLYAVLDEKKLAALDYYAWQNRNSQVGAESYIYNQMLNENINKKHLKKALEDFPDSEVLNVIHLKTNEIETEEVAIYAAMVAAEYPNLKHEKSSQKLRDYFKSLAKKINHKSYTETRTQ